METLDYYDYWYNQKQKKKLLPREEKSLKLISKLKLSKKTKFLDIGCGNGKFLTAVKKIFNINCQGIEYSKQAIKICKEKKLNVKFRDIEKKFPYKNNSFDIIYAGEIIEHLYNPDNFLEKCYKILKKDGKIIITTPNLTNWYNRILFLFGIQPIFIETSTKSKFVGAGILKKLKQDDKPIGHLRIFNYQALKDILELNKFRIIEINGVEFEYFPKKFLFLDRFFNKFTKLSSGFVLIAKKI